MAKPIVLRGTAIGQGRPKICVPIVGRTEKEILDKADELQTTPLDLVEWRADWYQEAVCTEHTLAVLRKLREKFKKRPLLFTFRTTKEGGEQEIDREEYLKLNEAVAESGLADLIDLELFTVFVEGSFCGKTAAEDMAPIASKARSAGTGIVMSSHDFSKTPPREALLRRFEAMSQAGADILKIAVMPETAEDVLTLLSATEEASRRWDSPLISMAMGGLGVISRLSGEVFGSSVTFASAGAASAPGQMDVAAVETILDTIHRGMCPDEGKLKNHVFLIGFMGTGKSTVSAELSARCGCSGLEMDQRIEKETGMEIRDIFSHYGEEYFRDLETDLLRQIRLEAPSVVSCGGGAVLRKENVEIMKSCGRIVLLTAEPETVLERVKGDDTRPNLKGRMNVSGIGELMEKRKASYNQAADISVATDGKTPGKIAEEILRFLQ